MSAMSDAFREARCISASVLRRSDAMGPPHKTTGSYDDDGLILDYHRKCSHPGCDVNLTSRSRYGKMNLCMPHGKEYDRERLRLRRLARGTPTREEMSAAAMQRSEQREAEAAATRPSKPAKALAPSKAPAEPAKASNPAPTITGLPILPKALQGALVAWLEAPGETATEINLQKALRDYELMARLRKAIPPQLQGLPIDHEESPMVSPYDPQGLNPDYRTTKLEFLADCATYGV
jgi:hypothetical protein